MLDLTTNKGKIIAAAIELAAETPWNDVTLRAIADRAGLSMLDMRSEVSSKAHIFGLFTSAVDKAVLAKAGALEPDQSPRDNLFETIMNRFDAMQPYKPAIKSILAGLSPDPRLAQRLMSSQGWMLEAAGISSYGALGGVKAVGLASVYMQVLRVWLDDDDPGLARTMAALDRRLRSGERSIQVIDDGCRALGRLTSLLKPRSRRRDKHPTDDTPPEQDAAPVADAPTAPSQGNGNATPPPAT